MITIVIPTFNRTDFLDRLITYYASIEFKGKILIGDSSNPEHLITTRKNLNRWKHNLNISHRVLPNLTVDKCHQELLSYLDTPYVACITDGGFLVPSTIYKCVSFLDENPDHVIAHGRALILQTQNDEPWGKIKNLVPYDLPAFNEETAQKRVFAHLSNYLVTMYCVYRTEVWKAIWEKVDLIKDRGICGEMLPCCLTAVFGKSGALDDLYMIRQIHRRRYTLPPMIDLLLCESWSDSYMQFERILAEQISRQDKISFSEAQKTVKEAYWNYLTGRIIKTYGHPPENLLYKHFHKLLRVMWRSVVSNPMSLNTLLSEKSKYYKDFLPVYNAINKKT